MYTHIYIYIYSKRNIASKRERNTIIIKIKRDNWKKQMRKNKYLGISTFRPLVRPDDCESQWTTQLVLANIYPNSVRKDTNGEVIVNKTDKKKNQKSVIHDVIWSQSYLYKKEERNRRLLFIDDIYHVNYAKHFQITQ